MPAEFLKPSVVPEMKGRFVPLRWHSARLEGERVDLKSILSSVPETGVYAFQGSRDGSNGRTVLYIGLGRASEGRSLGDRIQESLHARAGWEHDQGGLFPFSDNWDLTVHWAKVAEKSVELVEEVLIRGYAPAYNSKYVRGEPFSGPADVVIINAGTKGCLLPVVASMYFAKEMWDWFYE